MPVKNNYNYSDITLGEVARRLDSLRDDMNAGFTGIHERQNHTNGNVMDNTRWRLETNGTIRNLQKLVYSTVGFVLIAVGGAIIKLIII